MSDAPGRYARGAGLALAATGLTAVLTLLVIPNQTKGHGVPAAIAFQGLVQGMIASVVAASLVLLFRTSRIINFGALAFGSPGGLLTFETLQFTGAPFVLAVVMGLVVSGALGAAAELSFGRRFAKKSRLIFTIATIFISQFLVDFVQRAIVSAPFLPDLKTRPQNDIYDPVNGLPTHLPLSGYHFHVGSFGATFGFPHLFAIELVLITLLALGLVLRYSRLGVALRSVADNTERAAMLGISTGGVTTAAWAIAGVLGGVAVLLTGLIGNPGIVRPGAGGDTPITGAALLLPLTAAVLGRFRSIPAAFVASVLLGVLTSAVNYGYNDGTTYVAVGQLLLLVAGLLLQRRALFRLASAGEGSWRLTAEERPVPREMRSLTGIRVTKIVFGVAVLAFLGLVPWLFGAGPITKADNLLLLGIAGLSLVVLTGWAGQVSLGQWAFVTVGAVVAGGAASRGGWPFLLAVPTGTIVAALVAVLVGLPALRVKGLFLAVATFALSVATSVVMFDRDLFGWLLPNAITRPKIFISFDSEKPFYFLCLAAFVLTLLFVRNLRASRFGRLLIASRDNDAALQSAGVSIVRTRLTAFAISGGIAGFAGALLAFQLRTVSSAGFEAQQSVDLFVYAVLGGVSSVAGTLIGVGYLGAKNLFIGTGNIREYIMGFVPIGILFFFPGGVLSVLVGMRDALLRIIAQRRGMVVPALFRGVDAASLASRLTPLAPPLPSAGLAALPLDSRWSLDSRMHGEPGRALSDEESMDEQQLFAAAAAAVEATADEPRSPETESTPLVSTTGASA